jgi:hypothetical protein
MTRDGVDIAVESAHERERERFFVKKCTLAYSSHFHCRASIRTRDRRLGLTGMEKIRPRLGNQESNNMVSRDTRERIFDSRAVLFCSLSLPLSLSGSRSRSLSLSLSLSPLSLFLSLSLSLFLYPLNLDPVRSRNALIISLSGLLPPREMNRFVTADNSIHTAPFHSRHSMHTYYGSVCISFLRQFLACRRHRQK